MLCVRDGEDAQMYSQFGFRMLVAEEGKGLPEQRQICLRYQPTGAWCLFLDDDVIDILKPSHLSVHELVMLGFLEAKQRHARLWGLNTSSDQRNLRDSFSGQLGLVCG